MINYDNLGLYEPPQPRFIFKMPRVVADQKAKFSSDELFRRLARESEVRYTGYRERSLDERRIRFQAGCREGHTDVSLIATGTNMQLIFNAGQNPYIPMQEKECDFLKEPGKVHLRSHLIMNGVCVLFRGWLDLERLDGSGCLEYDEPRALLEHAKLCDQVDRYNQRMRDYEQAKLEAVRLAVMQGGVGMGGVVGGMNINGGGMNMNGGGINGAGMNGGGMLGGGMNSGGMHGGGMNVGGMNGGGMNGGGMNGGGMNGGGMHGGGMNGGGMNGGGMNVGGMWRR